MFPSRHRNGDNPSTSFLPPLSAKVGRPTDLSVSTEVKFQTVPRENATARCIPDISSQSENPLSRYNQLQLSRNTKGSISTALGPGRRISKANLGQRQVRLQTFRRNDAALQRLLQSRRQREQFRKKLVDIIL